MNYSHALQLKAGKMPFLACYNIFILKNEIYEKFLNGELKEWL